MPLCHFMCHLFMISSNLKWFLLSLYSSVITNIGKPLGPAFPEISVLLLVFFNTRSIRSFNTTKFHIISHSKRLRQLTLSSTINCWPTVGQCRTGGAVDHFDSDTKSIGEYHWDFSIQWDNLNYNPPMNFHVILLATLVTSRGLNRRTVITQ